MKQGAALGRPLSSTSTFYCTSSHKRRIGLVGLEEEVAGGSL